MDTSNILKGLENKQMRAARKSKEKESSPEELQRKTKAALYLRVSSDMQRENFSISAQKEECLRYINEHGYSGSDDSIFCHCDVCFISEKGCVTRLMTGLGILIQ